MEHGATALKSERRIELRHSVEGAGLYSLATPTAPQIAATRAVVEWYLKWHFRSSGEPGTVSMFANVALMGPFAVSARAVAANDADALFRVLVATAMFQRQRDVQVQRILRSVPPGEAETMLDMQALLSRARTGPCRNLRSLDRLHEECDLRKQGSTPVCAANPSSACSLKDHSRLLRRYGDFGKLPLSAALVVASEGSLPKLRRRVLRDESDPLKRALDLEAAVSRVWRVSTKIAAMFLSCVSNPDLSPEAPWAEGIDWSRFVVIDSNVESYLLSLGHDGGRDYADKRGFIRALAKKIDLRALDPRVQNAFNPRLVQQAMYVFMSAPNRKSADRDCSQLGAPACASCPQALARRCVLHRPEAPAPAASVTVRTRLQRGAGGAAAEIASQ